MPTKIQKPKMLKKGDLVCLVSPSSPMAALVPHRVERAVSQIEELGFRVKIANNALKKDNYMAGTPKERADDLNEAFRNPEIKMIMSFIGGNNANQLLELLDYEIIKNNPKIFVGYSDISVLHFAFYTQANLVTFYGPAALTQMADFPTISSYTLEYFRKALMQDNPIGETMCSTEWTDEILDWFSKKDLERPRKLIRNTGWKWLKDGTASGSLIGGCLPSILHLTGTRFWPDFKDTVLFLETPEAGSDFTKGISMPEIDAYLTNLELNGVFDRINGLIVGKPFGFTENERENFHRLLADRFKKYSFPILADINTGHTDPIMTLPLGIRALLDSEKNIFAITESAVQ